MNPIAAFCNSPPVRFGAWAKSSSASLTLAEIKKMTIATAVELVQQFDEEMRVLDHHNRTEHGLYYKAPEPIIKAKEKEWEQIVNNAPDPTVQAFYDAIGNAKHFTGSIEFKRKIELRLTRASD